MTATNTRISEIAQGVLDNRAIGRSEAVYLLELRGDDRYDLFYWANRIRLKYFDSKVSLCSIVSARTGSCSEDCRFCAQSAHYNTNVASISLAPGDIIQAAERAIDSGVHCFGIVTSGRRLSDDYIEQLAPVIAKVVGTGKIDCCASLGCITEEQAKKLHDCGIRRYNHNLETSSRYFGRIVSGRLSARTATMTASLLSKL